MAKRIRLTDEEVVKAAEEFAVQSDSRLFDGTIEFKRVFEVKDRKARVLFTPTAWIKMVTLLDMFDKEVGWYGVADRLGDEEKDEYLISDIIVYPQSVTAATVEMDDPEDLARWRIEHLEDDRFLSLRMHGHSHVRMGTSPSGVDLDHQKTILEQMSDDGFYIFMIYNKSLSKTVKIYDLKKNIMFGDKDITVGFYTEGESLEEFREEARKQVKEQTWKPAAPAAPAVSKPTTTPVTVYKAPAKEAPKAPVQGMGWKGSGRGFYNYDDDADEYWDPQFGWIPGDQYRRLGHGY